MLTNHARAIAIDVPPTIQQVSCNLMCVEDENPLATHGKVCQRSWIEIEVSLDKPGSRGGRSILFLPTLELLPWRLRQLEEVTEKRNTLGPRWQLPLGITVLDGPDCVDRNEGDRHAKCHRVGLKVEVHGWA